MALLPLLVMRTAPWKPLFQLLVIMCSQVAPLPPEELLEEDELEDEEVLLDELELLLDELLEELLDELLEELLDEDPPMTPPLPD